LCFLKRESTGFVCRGVEQNNCAHTKDLEIGQITKELITPKRPYGRSRIRRGFFRENDKILSRLKYPIFRTAFSSGSAQIVLFDARQTNSRFLF